MGIYVVGVELAPTALPLSFACKEHLMSFLVWINLGLIAGFVASKIVNRTGEGLVLDTILGIVGAIFGGLLFAIFGGVGVSGLNLHSLIVAVVGAIAVLLIYHAFHRTV
jgi:uncharacterized membrane protein YeaQ/YmgE (transglycosylase-associated protein family)